MSAQPTMPARNQSPRPAVVGGATYLPPECEHITEIQERFRLRNPEWGQAMALRNKGKWVQLPEEYLSAVMDLPLYHAWAGGVQVPRCLDLGSYGMETLSKTVFPGAEKLSFVEGVSLRDYQHQAVSRLCDKLEGIVVAPCGAGKTTIGMGAIAALDTPAIVFVHTLDLARQWVDRCKQQLGVDARLVGGGKNEAKDGQARVVVATIQTLQRWRWDERYAFGRRFGLAIVDEAHHVPATSFAEVLMTMPARYRLGLTATPDRPDGLTEILHWHLGDVLHEVKTEDLVKRGLVMAPRVEWMRTVWKPPAGPKLEWPKLVNKMCEDDDRTASILDWVSVYVEQGRQVLVLSDRVQHCIDMAEEMSQWASSAALVGKVSKSRRAEILKKADEGEIRVIFATSLADEGLDLPGLDTVVLTTPTKAMGRVQQRIGRIMRPREGKRTPLVVDVVDDHPAFIGLARKRARLYQELGCDIGGWPQHASNK